MIIPSQYRVKHEYTDKEYIYIEDDISKICLYRYYDDDTIIYLSNLYVDTNMRNKGIGTRLVSMCENIAENLGINKIILFVEKNSWMQKWYTRLGYKKLKTFQEKPSTGIWMEKTLC